MNLDQAKKNLPYSPFMSIEEIEKEFKKLKKVSYNRFTWFNSYEPKNKKLPRRKAIEARIYNGDFNLSHYLPQVQYTEHRLNLMYLECYPNQEDYLEKAKTTINRRQKLLEKYLSDEEEKLRILVEDLAIRFNKSEKEIGNKLKTFQGTPEELLEQLTKEYEGTAVKKIW